MQALQITRHGSPADLHATDIPRPVPRPGEVLVEVEASAINPSDAVSVEGRFPHSPLPRVVGRDFAGRVVEGPPGLIGSEVWGAGGDLGIARDGTHAEYVVIPQEAVALRPKSLSAEQAASVGVPFQTAWCAVAELGQVREGEWVIVSGAAGAVGGAAVQLAAARGARVIALVKNQGDHARLDRQKVAAVVHSEDGDLALVVRETTGGQGVGLAINGIGGAIFQPLLEALADGGRMVIFSAAGGREAPLDFLSFYRRRLVLLGLNTAVVDVVQGARIMDQLAPLFEAGAIAPPRIAERYPLSRAAEAYGRLSQGVGKVALLPDRYFSGTTSGE